MHRTTLATAIVALTLTACTTSLEPGPSDIYLDAVGAVSEETQVLRSGNYVSSAWVSESFDGVHTRDLQANRLFFTIDNGSDQGGWDGSVSLPEDRQGPDSVEGVSVEEVGDGAVACTAYHLDVQTPEGASSSWWAGPKISVNWQSMEDPAQPGDWYENYIIETGSKSPEAWERDMRSWIEVDLFAETQIAGSAYKHYKVRFKDWWQFWSVRQDQRDAGSVPIKPILEVWQTNGLPGEFRVDGVKANVETHGPLSVTGQMAATFNTGGLGAETGSCEVPIPRISVVR